MKPLPTLPKWAPIFAGGVQPAGQPAGPIAVAPQSRVAPPPTIAQPRSRGLLDRLLPVPGALRGLLGDDDVSGARASAIRAFGGALLEASGPSTAPVSLGQALGRAVQAGGGTLQQGYAGAAQQNVATSQLAQEMGAKQRQEQFRQRAAQLIQPGMNQQQQFEAWQQLAAEAAAAGVDLGPISQIVNATKPPVPKVKPPIAANLGGKTVYLDPDTMKPVAEFAHTPSPKDPHAPDTAQQLRDQRMFAREQQLADDFHAEVKPDVLLVRKMQGALNELPSALTGNGAAQVNMLYAFVNAMDPASAVREGEIGLAQAAASLRARAQTLIEKYSSSGSASVPKEMLQQMGALMQRRVGMARDYVGAQEQMYRERAGRWGVNADVFRAVGLPTVGAPAAPPGPAPATAGGDSVRKKLGGIR